MLRLKLCVLTVFRFRLCVFSLVFSVLLSLVVRSRLPLRVASVSSDSGVVRLTKTVEQAVNLNPSLSDDGRVVVFESSANLFAGGLNDSFHAIRCGLGSGPPEFHDLAASRIVSPSLSSDGSVIVFASREDLVGENFDRNSEIFLLNSSGLKQLTHTSAETHNIQPSITADGRLIAFVSNENLTLFDVNTNHPTPLTNATGASSPKLSGDGSKLYYQQGSDLLLIDLKTKTRTGRRS